MFTKSSPRETSFAPGTSRNCETGITFRLAMARDEAELLAMGARIKELREAHGYSQQWIADQVGVQLRTYQFWQAGAHPPEQESLEKLASLFGVTPKYILRGETPDVLSEGKDQLSRIEDKLDRVLTALGEPIDEAEAPDEAASLPAHPGGVLPPTGPDESPAEEAPAEPATAQEAEGQAGA